MIGEVTGNKKQISNKVLLTILGVLIILIVALIVGLVVHNTINNVEKIEGGEVAENVEEPGAGSGPSVSSGNGVGENDYGWPTESEETNYVAYEDMTDTQKEAYDYINTYFKQFPLSRNSVIRNLENEGYSSEDAVIVADSCGINYDDNAVKSAAAYLEQFTNYYDHDSLIEALRMEGFTQEQAENGVEQNNI